MRSPKTKKLKGFLQTIHLHGNCSENFHPTSTLSSIYILITLCSNNYPPIKTIGHPNTTVPP